MKMGRKPGWLYQQNHCGVYRTKNAGEQWIDISKGLPSRFGFAMALDPNADGTMYVFPSISPQERYTCDGRMGVYRTTDAGKSWTLLKRGLPQKNVFTQVLRHGATTDNCEKAGVYFGTSGGTLYYSTNGGQAWQVLSANMPAILSVDARVF